MKALSLRLLRPPIVFGFLPLFFLTAGLFLPALSPAMEAGARIGYGSSPDADGAAPSAGAFLRFDLPGPVNLELSGDYCEENIFGGAAEAMNVPLQVTALLYPIPSPVLKPYLLGGAGLTFVSLSPAGPAGGPDGDYRLFGVHAGGGLELPLAGVGGVAGEFRYSLTEEAGGTGYSPGGWRLFATFFLSF